MKHRRALICALGTLLAAGWSAPAPVRAAAHHAASQSFEIAALSGNQYAPRGMGAVTSAGISGDRLTLSVALRDMPAPAALGGIVYKAWLVYPASPAVMPGGLLTYHADGTVDGSFTTTYHEFTVIAVTAERQTSLANPQNPTIMQGSANPAGLRTALVTSLPQPVVEVTHQAAAYNTAMTSRQGAVAATSEVTLPRKARALLVYDAVATANSTIVLMPLSDPYGPLWVSARGAGSFTISAAHALPGRVRIQYAIING